MGTSQADDFEVFLRESGQLPDASVDDGWMAIQDECDTEMFALEAERIDKEKARVGLDEQADIALEKEAFLLDFKRAANLPHELQLDQMGREAAMLRGPAAMTMGGMATRGMQPMRGMTMPQAWPASSML